MTQRPSVPESMRETAGFTDAEDTDDLRGDRQRIERLEGQVRRYEDALRRIAVADYRGNRPWAAQVAVVALRDDLAPSRRAGCNANCSPWCEGDHPPPPDQESPR